MKGITEIKGIKVGHYTDKTAMTGCTAVLFEGGAVGGVDVRGRLRAPHCIIRRGGSGKVQWQLELQTVI